MPREVKRLAVIGGMSFVEDDLRDWLTSLYAKHPTVSILIGNGRGAEQAAARIAVELGFQCERSKWVQDWQDAILEVNYLVADVDAVLIVGSTGGERAKRALEILKRVDTCREPHNKRHVIYVGAKPVEKKAAKPRRATKKRETLAT